MITKPNLDTKKPVGNGVSAPEFAGETSDIISTKSADVKNSSTDLNTTASSENLSAKFKGGAQDVPEAGRNQFE